MPSLRSATATAIPVAPVVPFLAVEEPFTPTAERRVEERETDHGDRRARAGRADTPVVFATDQPRWSNAYTKVIDLALVLACLAIFVGVLAVGTLG